MWRKIFIFFILFLILGQYSCLDKEYYPIEIPLPNPSISIPIGRLEANLGELADLGDESTQFQIDQEGKITLIYEGQLLSQTAATTFPTIPWFNDFPIADSLAPLPLPIGQDFIIEKAIFDNNTIFFKFRTTLQEDIKVTMRMPELSKDGQVFEFNYDMVYSGGEDNYFESPVINLDGYLAETDDSNLYFQYDARRSNGERIVFDEAFMNIDFIRFSYMQGYFGNRSFALEDSVIPIGIFDNWISGGFSFDQPRLTFDIVNSFGIPVTCQFNKLSLTTLDGSVQEIESDIIDSGIDFNYPGISEVGSLSATEFTIDANNSNIEDIFNQKVTQLNYQVEAIVNPGGVDPVIGFYDKESYFNINTRVEVPLHLNIDDLVLRQSFEIDLSTYPEISKGELLFSIKNALPMNAELEILFENAAGEVNDILQMDNVIRISENNVEGQASEAQALQIFKFPLTSNQWTQIRESRKMVLNVKLNTKEDINYVNEYIWIYDYQGIDLRISATIQQ